MYGIKAFSVSGHSVLLDREYRTMYLARQELQGLLGKSSRTEPSRVWLEMKHGGYICLAHVWMLEPVDLTP